MRKKGFILNTRHSGTETDFVTKTVYFPIVSYVGYAAPKTKFNYATTTPVATCL